MGCVHTGNLTTHTGRYRYLCITHHPSLSLSPSLVCDERQPQKGRHFELEQSGSTWHYPDAGETETEKEAGRENGLLAGHLACQNRCLLPHPAICSLDRSRTRLQETRQTAPYTAPPWPPCPCLMHAKPLPRRSSLPCPSTCSWRISGASWPSYRKKWAT